MLNLIRAHALLHQATRERDDNDRIIATLTDYTAVRELVCDLVSEGVEATVPGTLRETVQAVRELLDAQVPGQPGVSVTQLAQRLALDKAAASRRQKVACDRGYLRNLETQRGKPARLVLGDPLPDDLEILPTPEQVAERAALTTVSSGRRTPPPPNDANAAEVEPLGALAVEMDL
jgi:hypothetical protein